MKNIVKLNNNEIVSVTGGNGGGECGLSCFLDNLNNLKWAEYEYGTTGVLINTAVDVAHGKSIEQSLDKQAYQAKVSYGIELIVRTILGIACVISNYNNHD